MGLMQRAMGYVMRYGGGAAIAWTMYNTIQESMLPEETIGGVIGGGVVYMIGHFMEMREIAVRDTNINGLRLDVERKIESHLEKIANGGVRTNILDK